MAGLSNPRKDFRYILEIDGLNAFLVQEVQAPTLELPKIMHGSAANDPDEKTPGKLQVGDLVLKKLVSANVADSWAHNWMAQAMVGGATGLQKIGFIKELGVDGNTVVQKFFLGKCWPTKIERGNLNSVGNGNNMIETVTIACKYYYDTNSPEFAALFGAGLAAGIVRAAGVDQ